MCSTDVAVAWDKVDKLYNKINNKKKPKPPPEPKPAAAEKKDADAGVHASFAVGIKGRSQASACMLLKDM